MATHSFRRILNGDSNEYADRPLPDLESYAHKVAAGEASVNQDTVAKTKDLLQDAILDRMNVSVAAKMTREKLAYDLMSLVSELIQLKRISLNIPERNELIKQLVDDMLGLGPLEPLLANDSISEIMINGPDRIYIEQNGKILLSDVTLKSHAHIQAIASRIVTQVGRRVDESTPICDARLADGSRVNIILPPLAIDSPIITIRKFAKRKIILDTMVKTGSLSLPMAHLLSILGKCRANILISGGTGSGKTTLLNALSRMIDGSERIVTIEDAAELQLQQPHVVRLETRPPNLEGRGEVTMRDLVRNALRMRPDRIIIGETRGSEALDMLQAMNTGHDGSLSTIHANSPREALSRLETMVGLVTPNLSHAALRQQIASAIDVVIQVCRMRDGSRRITHISEIVGMEESVITMQDIFSTEIMGENINGHLTVDFNKKSYPKRCLSKIKYFGLENQLSDILR